MRKRVLTAGIFLGMMIMLTPVFGFQTLVRVDSAAAVGNDCDALPSLTVNVTNALTGDPIARATVQAEEQFATTDYYGIAILTGLPVSSFPVSISATGYVNSNQTATLECGDQKSIDVSLLPSDVAQIFVSSNGYCGIGVVPCYKKIQEAIDDAPDGSEILVRQGIYNESISLTSAKTVIVKGGYDYTWSQQRDNTTFIQGLGKTTIQASSGSLKFQMLSILSPPTWTDPVTGMVFVWVAGGCYEMGCGSWTDNCDDNEKPVHQVCVDGFWIGKYEVTQGQWEQIMGSNPSHFDSGDNYPVETVSWDDCQIFIDDLNSRSGNIFRLPTEAEWEYAARSGGREEKYAGGDNLDSLGWYLNNSESRTHEAGTKVANGLGIYDMSGNVYEWCSDWYASGYYAGSPPDNPQGPSTGSFRVGRGAGWRDFAWFCRSAFRGRNTPGYRDFNLGFRLAFSAGQ